MLIDWKTIVVVIYILKKRVSKDIRLYKECANYNYYFRKALTFKLF